MLNRMSVATRLPTCKQVIDPSVLRICTCGSNDQIYKHPPEREKEDSHLNHYGNAESVMLGENLKMTHLKILTKSRI